MTDDASAADMPPNSPLSKVVRFGPHTVTNHVFHRTPHTYSIVNIRPLLPGHVLVCPWRIVPHLYQLSPAEVTDLFLTVQRVQRTLRRVYGAEGFNVGIQDGKAAGQSVAHVHCHIIPRRKGDMDSRGGGDRIYEMMEGEEGDVGKGLTGREQSEDQGKVGQKEGRRFKTDEERKDRSEEEMREEADMLAREMEKDHGTEEEE
ncbi:bis-tetraphosphatase [Myriangium duriaei CBS 260.36]|uniref:Bis(5'-adenosyl)-triphosphatase n=1 Tax=Myriangium duriaei CBS 260.36 TaxID=1168546 RepID=A0A9P4IY73_9PEZI|nr:bis-tetraphosphatase [Myriangium duriaei CBS 260.36]